jgi:hypothetical protein
MPKVNVEKAESLITSDEGRKILKIVVKKNGTLRASKPKVKDALTGKAAYVWRMVAFLTSPKPAHQCMPTTCDWDLQVADENGKWRYSLARELAKTLKPIEDAIVDSIKMGDWHGVHAWGRILG